MGSNLGAREGPREGGAGSDQEGEAESPGVFPGRASQGGTAGQSPQAAGSAVLKSQERLWGQARAEVGEQGQGQAGQGQAGKGRGKVRQGQRRGPL